MVLRIQRMLERDAPAPAQTPTLTLTLPFEQRQKSRLRTRLDDGTEAGLFLPRGTLLLHGDRLIAVDGRVVLIQAAVETVSVATAASPLLLTRAAYHLGNRHVPLQVQSAELRYSHDHVLDDMVRQLGLAVVVAQASFQPEPGAYHGGHSHDTDHSHAH